MIRSRGSHHHRRAQFVFAVRGVMEVVTARGGTIQAPRQAVWMPPGLTHDVRFKTRVPLRSAYVHPARYFRDPTTQPQARPDRR